MINMRITRKLRLLLAYMSCAAFCPLAACRSDDQPDVTLPDNQSNPSDISTATDASQGPIGLGFEINGVKWDGKSNLSGQTYNILGD